MRNIELATGSFYHVYNRGVDKRNIFLDQSDIERFFSSMLVFNTEKRIESIRPYLRFVNRQDVRHLVSEDQKLVHIIAYCLNPNHFHLQLEQAVDKGIEKYMHKLGSGYTKYFNEKYKRNGSLFQGTYKAVYIESNVQLLHTSVYINLNNRTHSTNTYALSASSWPEYLSPDDKSNGICKKDIILNQFKTPQEYSDFAESSYEDIVINKSQRLDKSDT